MKSTHFFLTLCLAACGLVGSASAQDAAPQPETTPQPAAEVAQTFSFEFLRVHPQNDRLVAEGAREVPGYRRAEQIMLNDADGTPLLDVQGKPATTLYWIQTRAAAEADGCYIGTADIESCSADPARSHILDIRFTAEGARKMRHMTSAMEIGRDRLAIVVNGTVYSAPVVQDTLSRQTCITGFAQPELDAILSALPKAEEVERDEE